jgi:hypothetical protein
LRVEMVVDGVPTRGIVRVVIDVVVVVVELDEVAAPQGVDDLLSFRAGEEFFSVLVQGTVAYTHREVSKVIAQDKSRDLNEPEKGKGKGKGKRRAE